MFAKKIIERFISLCQNSDSAIGVGRKKGGFQVEDCSNEYVILWSESICYAQLSLLVHMKMMILLSYIVLDQTCTCRWVIVSSAINHMSTTSNHLSNFHESIDKHISIANGSQICIKGIENFLFLSFEYQTSYACFFLHFLRIFCLH